MVVFECVACGAALTVPLTRVAMPDHADHQVGNGVLLPALLEPGAYAAGSDTIVLAPGDLRGAAWSDEQLDRSSCRGLAGSELPDLRCTCGQPVAMLLDDCSWWREVRLEARAVRQVGEPEPVAGWDTFDWGSALLDDADVWWHDRVRTAAGVALARIVVAAKGAAVTVPDGPVAEVFRHHLDELLSGPGQKTLAPAGPGLTAEADLLLVPKHPQSGEPWPADGTAVPISAELWRWLANPHQQPCVPATGGRWPFLDDDPLPRRPERIELNRWATRSEMSKRP